MIKYNKSSGGSFAFPTSLKDIFLQQYIDFLNIVEPTKPEELTEIETLSEQLSDLAPDSEEYQSVDTELTEKTEALNGVVLYKKIFPYYARVVSHFADGLEYADIVGGKHSDGMNIGHLTFLYKKTVELLNSYVDDGYSPVIEVDNELWYLPQRYMEKSTFIEYAEASQFEANMKDLQNGNWLALPKIMCILVRKEGEKYSDRLLKREEMFLKWNLENCLRVAFFLLRLNVQSLQNLELYTAARQLTKLKQEYQP